MRRSALRLFTSIACCLILMGPARAPAAEINKQYVDQALHAALQGTGAVAVVINLSDGRLLATTRSREAALQRATPGSILKPLFLAEAFQSKVVTAQTSVICHRDLHIAGKSLACTHPQSNVSFQAEEALAYSCNTYFAELALQLTPAQGIHTLKQYGLTHPTHLFPVETEPFVQTPTSTAELQLLILGLSGVGVTPAQVAVAYRNLLVALNNPQLKSKLEPIQRGLEDSVRFGMAHNADVPGMEILGKTGTARMPGASWTHGWFAGSASLDGSSLVIAIYVDHGSGADAAHIAQRFFVNWKVAVEGR